MSEQTCKLCGQPANDRAVWFDTLTLHNDAYAWQGQLSGKNYYCDECTCTAAPPGIFALASHTGDSDAWELPDLSVMGELLCNVNQERTKTTGVLNILITAIVDDLLFQSRNGITAPESESPSA